MGKREPTWIQAELFEGGHTEVTIELTVHLGGPASMELIGYSVKDTATGELLAITAFDSVERIGGAQATVNRIYSLVCKALANLEPFG